ncbi:MAG: hypothetical protein GDA39_02410 [Hyphomonadaceae bacterium]|nr:hypothetical protein [Hyphomonadaceae bacterium]MBC6411824.1 hypothetical protein [Hyphomonadaceae bacterium]
MIIIHAGMHKTGSSSIQETFAKLDGNRVDYAPWRAANHSGLFFTLFHSSPEKQGGFRLVSTSPDEIGKSRDTWGKRFRQMLERRREQQTTRPMIISTETVSSAATGREEAVEKMADYLRSHSSEDVRVIAYVRPPRSLMSSGFQQVIKSGRGLNLAKYGNRPNYRARFEKLDRIFGRENVTLKLFQRDSDVVLDFAHEIGIALDPGGVVRTNESMSLEATAMLYVHTRLGNGFQPRTRDERLRLVRFVDRLSKLGTRRFVLSDTLTDPLIEANRADLDWMEARLGAPLSEPPVPQGQGVEGEAHLINAAIAARPLIEQEIADLSGPDTPAFKTPASDAPAYELARRLDLLKDF